MFYYEIIVALLITLYTHISINHIQNYFFTNSTYNTILAE